jgi:hypothetical protein
MAIQQQIKRSSVILILMMSMWAPIILGLDAVASIKSIRGQVEIERENRVLPGRVGLILYERDVVFTNPQAKVSIIFRDGSIIRLFPKTRFIIEKSVETKKGARKFLHRFMLKVGAIWGKFTQKRQETVIITPTATAGVKGTNVAFSQMGDKFSVSLSEGQVTIKNEDDSVTLTSGQMVENVTKRGLISDKVKRLPYQIIIDPGRIYFKEPIADGKSEIVFSLQLMDLMSNQQVERAGNIHLTSDLDKIEFPANVKLNARGYARVTAKITALEPHDLQYDNAEILALIDDRKYLDIGAGRAIVAIDPASKKSRKIKIDVQSGTVN